MEEQYEKLVKLNAEIPVVLKKKLEIYCVIKGVYIKDIVAQAIEEFLQQNETPSL